MLRGLVVVAALLVVPLAPGTLGEPAPASAAWPDEWLLVGYKQMPDVGAGSSLMGGRVLGTIPRLGVVAVSAADLGAAEASAGADPNVRYVERDGPRAVRGGLTPNDTWYPSSGHWGTRMINAHLAWDAARGSTDVLVAVIDSGLWFEHEEFAGDPRFLPGVDFVNGDLRAEDACGHGTAVTGEIAAGLNNAKGIAGMADVTVLPLKVLDGSLPCFGSHFDIARAFEWAGNASADVISVSIWGGFSSTTREAMRYAHSQGAMIVGIAGNGGPCTNCTTSFWGPNGDISLIVSATTRSETLAYFSSEGPEVDLAAPGEGILAPMLGSTSSYGGWSGTSMAAPYVAGTIALMKSADPEADNVLIEQRIKAKAKDLGAPGKDDKFGYGRLDTAAAAHGFQGDYHGQFSQAGGNAWWAQVHVDANRKVQGVDARIGNGSWMPLKLRSWGDWAETFPVADGSILQFRASNQTHGHILSGCYAWPAATPAPCPGDPLPNATFVHKTGNAHWVEVLVSPEPSKVEAMDTAGPWVTLTKRSWGAWAASFPIESGNLVRFRATYPAGAVESCWFTHPAGDPQCDPRPVYSAEFTNVRGNSHWIESDVTATNGELASVWARINGGSWTALSLQSWGSWAKNIAVPAGATVQFQARAPDGRTAESDVYAWPPT